jgi:hypothetical protein
VLLKGSSLSGSLPEASASPNYIQMAAAAADFASREEYDKPILTT